MYDPVEHAEYGQPEEMWHMVTEGLDSDESGCYDAVDMYKRNVHVREMFTWQVYAIRYSN